MESEESILANRICGCATNQQHSADVAAIREYRANVVAPFLARIEQLEARVRDMSNALEPFAKFAANFVDSEGWNEVGLSVHKERISYWFGPSDFRAALHATRAAALSDLIAADADLIHPVCDETEGDCA